MLALYIDMAEYIDTAWCTITCKGNNKKIGKGCVPAAKAAEAMWSELKAMQREVNWKGISWVLKISRTFDLTKEIPSVNVKHAL